MHGEVLPSHVLPSQSPACAGSGSKEHLELMRQLGAGQQSMLPALIALCSSFVFLF